MHPSTRDMIMLFVEVKIPNILSKINDIHKCDEPASVYVYGRVVSTIVACILSL